MKSILLISPYWKEDHRWMVSSVKLAELWQRMGYRVIVACMGSQSSVEHVSDTLIIHRRKDFFLPDPLNFGIAFGFFPYVLAVIRREKPDVIFCNKILFWTSFSVIPLRMLGHRVLVATDALVGMTWWPRSFLPKVIMACGGWTMGWLVLLCAHKVRFFHPQPASLLRRLGIARKCDVIPTGINVEAFGSAEKLLASKPTDRVTVTYVGRLESVKGVDDFAEAAAGLLGEHPALDIQIVGWYKDNHPLVERFHGRIRFTGLRDDIPAILASSHIFVLPSYSEGLSNALMEAMSSCCACIASEVGGNRYLLQNGVSGFLYPAGDREALRAHIRRLIQDPAKRRSMAAAARERIEKVFSWSIIAKQYDALFSDHLAS